MPAPHGEVPDMHVGLPHMKSRHPLPRASALGPGAAKSETSEPFKSCFSDHYSFVGLKSATPHGCSKLSVLGARLPGTGV